MFSKNRSPTENFIGGVNQSMINSSMMETNINDINQSIILDLGSERIITGVKIQGRKDADEWIKTFKVSHSTDNNFYNSR